LSASRLSSLAAALCVGAALAPLGALAQVAAQHVGLLLTVSHASSQPGPIDPSAAELHRSLRSEFRYESLRVLERRHMDLRMQEVGGVDLPTGKHVEVRPLSVTPAGVLIAVEIPGTLQTDLRVPNQKQVVIGVDRYEDGKLILILQPDY
jgi:hypothetical protein